jgi:hypothetical protein
MITETAAARTPSTRRPRRLGDGMLTPVEVLEFRNPQTGSVEQLRPGRDCVAPQWWAYRKHPELFMPVHRDDTRTIARHRQVLEGTRRRLEREMGTTRTMTSSRPKCFQLSDPPRGRFRLP